MKRQYAIDNYPKRKVVIDSAPANDDWKPPPYTRKPAKSTRKEFPRAPDSPQELDDGYFNSLLADADRFRGV